MCELWILVLCASGKFGRVWIFMLLKSMYPLKNIMLQQLQEFLRISAIIFAMPSICKVLWRWLLVKGVCCFSLSGMNTEYLSEQERQAELLRLRRERLLAEKSDNLENAALMVGLAERQGLEAQERYCKTWFMFWEDDPICKKKRCNLQGQLCGSRKENQRTIFSILVVI